MNSKILLVLVLAFLFAVCFAQTPTLRGEAQEADTKLGDVQRAFYEAQEAESLSEDENDEEDEEETLADADLEETEIMDLTEAEQVQQVKAQEAKEQAATRAVFDGAQVGPADVGIAALDEENRVQVQN